jgi:hypothetical protein
MCVIEPVLAGNDLAKEYSNMNMKNHKLATALLSATLSLAVTSAYAKLSDEQIASATKTLNKAATVELAPTAVQLVTKALAADRVEMAVVATRAVVAKNPSAVVTVVAAISEAAPETSPAVAAAASKLLADQAEAIAMAAAKAAPSSTEKIMQAVLAEFPTVSEKSAAVPYLYSVSEELTKRQSSRADSAGALATITVKPGPLNTNLVFTTGPTPAGAASLGYDPKRYAQP